MHRPTVIETVVTAASNYDLIDLTTLKTLLAITTTDQDAYLALVISQASAAAAQYCNRVFPAETVTNSFWPPRDEYPIAWRGVAPPVQLTRWPIQSITSVIETASNGPLTLTVNVDYLADRANGRLFRLDSTGYPTKWQPRPLAVTFSGGFAATPPDVVGAIAGWIKAMRAAQTRDPNLRSMRLPGVAEATYTVGGEPMPVEVSSVLDNYREVLIG